MRRVCSFGLKISCFRANSRVSGFLLNAITTAMMVLCKNMPFIGAHYFARTKLLAKILTQKHEHE